MQRYFVSNKENDTYILNQDDSHHIINVMRMNINDEIEVVYDSKLYICSIISVDNLVRCKQIREIETSFNNIPKVIIAQSLVKEQKMDYILQKSCELGVTELIPLITTRSIIKVDKNDNKKVSRWQKILKEASEQSKRIDIPNVGNIMGLKDLVNVNAKYKFVCSVKEKSKTIKSILSNVNNSDTILFVIGPEGGLDNYEEEFLINNGFISITFGNNVLRTETASSFILSVINYEFMR